MSVCERARIPFAPIARPEDLFDDPHLRATGGLMPTTLPNGVRTALPRLPIHVADADLAIRCDPPRVGQDTRAVLAEAGYDPAVIERLVEAGSSWPTAPSMAPPTTHRARTRNASPDEAGQVRRRMK